MVAADLLRQREFRGIQIALIARLVIIVIALPIDQTLAVASRVGQINSLINLAGGFVAAALLLIILHRTRRIVLVGLAAVIVDVALMTGLLVGWWDSIGGLATPIALLFKSAMGGLMAVVLILFMRMPRQQIVHVIETASRTVMRRKPKAQEKTHIVGGGAKKDRESGPRLRLTGILGDGEPIRIDLVYETIKNAANGLNIGRDEYSNEIAVADDSVSRRHARVNWADDAVMLEDMDSTNGTLINDEQLTAFQPQSIKDGDTIKIGTVEFAVKQVS